MKKIRLFHNNRICNMNQDSFNIKSILNNSCKENSSRCHKTVTGTKKNELTADTSAAVLLTGVVQVRCKVFDCHGKCKAFHVVGFTGKVTHADAV